MKTLPIADLCAATFSDFGEVLECGGDSQSINEGSARRFDALSVLDAADMPSAISLFHAVARDFPITIAMLECHPKGRQAFLSAMPNDWLVVVANGDADAPDINALQCFRARGNQGVHYHRGVWHHPLLILQPQQLFWVIDKKIDNNLCEFWFAHHNLNSATVELT